jgi:hypothetical protein
MKRSTLLFFLVLALAFSKEPVFLLHQIGVDHSEGVAVFDFDRDGRLDVTSGAYWYKAPDWTRHKFREAGVFGEFVSNCGEFAIDVNRDRYPDIITAGWMEDGIFYLENPRRLGVQWNGVKIRSSKNTEGMVAADVDGDGNLDILPCHFSRNPVFWIQIKDGKFGVRPVAETGSNHGVGFGDVDGDGKGDILTPNGWYRQADLSQDKREYHPDFRLGLAGLAMYVYDFNADGLPDVLYSKAHDYGLYWLEQRRQKDGRRSWIEHPIDLSYSQIHNLKLVDLDGDGKPEILAGKRYRGHNGKDAGSFHPLAIYYYQIETGSTPKFARHPVAYNSIAGAGTQFVVIDLDGDGDVDIVCAGKTGQYWFENLTLNTIPRQDRELLFDRYPTRR